jgi:hypothetical protein
MIGRQRRHRRIAPTERTDTPDPFETEAIDDIKAKLDSQNKDHAETEECFVSYS